MIKRLLLFFILFVSMTGFQVFGQDQKKNDKQPTRFNYKKLTTDPSSEYYNENINQPKDNVVARYNFQFSRLKNPATGKVPKDIRQKELEYVKSQRSRLQRENNDIINFKNGINIETANGDPVTPWVNRGPYNVGGRTRALAIDIDDENILLAGGVSGGMWRSTDQGTSWTRVTSASQHPTVTDVVQDPRTGFHDTWYYSTGERLGASQSARNGSGFLQGNGIYKSTDNGVTWSILSSTTNSTPGSFDSDFDLIFGVDINPINGDLFVATMGGIYRSTDAGSSFTEVLPSDYDNFTDIHITSSGVIYAAMDNGGGSGGIFRTTDGATGTWSDITPANFPTSFSRTVIHTAPSNEDILYVLADGTPSGPVSHDFWKYTYVSGDGTGAGGDWENRSSNLPNFGGSVGDFNSQGGYDLYVRVHPNDPDIVFIGGTNLYRSTDGFATASGEWIAGYSPLNNVSLYTNHHPDQHSLEFFPSNPNKVLSGHDGGVGVTDNILEDNGTIEPVTWTSLNNGYLTTQVYALSIGPGDQLMSGFQDNSTWFTNNTNPTDTWVDLFSGDGSYNAFNEDGTVRYVSSQTGNIFRVTYADANSSEGTSFTGISPAEGLFVAPFELDPNNDEIMYYAASEFLWRNDDLTNASTSAGWTQLTNAAALSNVSIMGVSSIPANIVYFGTVDGEVYRIDEAHTGNPAATDIYTAKGLPDGNVSSLNVNPYDADDVIATFSNYGIKSIFQTLDGGNTWTDISGNLEENPDGTGNGPSVRWAARIGNDDRYFVGTSTGLYSTTTLNGTSTTWTQEDLDGVSNAVIEQLRTRNSDGLVVAGTHGNGLYSATFEVSLPDVNVDNPLSDITVEAGAADDVIDISNVFASTTNPIQGITVTVENNSNPSLVSANISGNNLTLSYIGLEFGESVITLLATDGSGETSSTQFSITVLPPPVTSFPYIVDFETGIAAGWNKSGAMSWVLNSGSTPSTGTGPSIDNTLGNANGQFLFSEATGSDEGNQAIITSREVDLTSVSTPILQFYYHMYGADMGSLKVEVNDLTNVTTTEIFSITGEQQAAEDDPYTIAATSGIDLSDYIGSIIEVNFIATRGAGFTSDVAIDDIEFLDIEAPQNFQATNVNTESFDLNWDAVPNADNYKVSVSTDGFATFLPDYEEVEVNATTLEITGLSPETNYEIRIQAFVGDYTSNYAEISGGVTTLAYPVAAAATDIDFYSFTANWDAYSGANSYKIEVSDDNFTTNLAAYDMLDLNATSVAVSGLEPNTEYEYRITVDVGSVLVGPSEPISVTTLDDSVLPPSNLVVTENAGDLVLTWTDNSDLEESYVIERKAAAEVTFSEYATVAADVVTYTDTNVNDNVTYVYRVFGKSTADESPYSNEASIIIAPVQPTAPSALQLTENTASVGLSWTDNSLNEQSFVIERKVSPATAFSEYASVSANVTTYEDEDKVADKTITYRVYAKNSAGNSGLSNEVEITTAPEQPDVPAVPVAPGNLSATASTSGIVLSWSDNSDNETAFVVSRKQTAEGDFVSLDTLEANVVSFTDTSIEANRTYYYSVYALNGESVSERSNQVTVLSFPSSPVAVEAVEISSTSFVARWTKQNAGVEYLVDVSANAFETTLEGFAGKVVADTAILVDGLEASTQYEFRLKSKNGSGASSYSNVISVTTLGVAPAAPSELVSDVNDRQVTLTWVDNSDNETAFEIERKVSGEEFTSLASVAADVTEYTDDLSAVEENVSYRVYATNSIGSSDFTNLVEVSFEVTANDKRFRDLVKVAPNPSNGRISVFVNNSFKIRKIRVMDLAGRLVLERVVDRGEGVDSEVSEYTVDISEQYEGVYMLQILSVENETIFRKIIKE